MKRSLTILFLLLFTFSFVACASPSHQDTSKPNPDEASNNLSAEASDDLSYEQQDPPSSLQTSPPDEQSGGPGVPPLTFSVPIESEKGMNLLYQATKCSNNEEAIKFQQQEAWSQELKNERGSLQSLRSLWEDLEHMPLLSLQQVPNVEGFSLTQYTTYDFYDFIYLAGGWQYRIQYTKTPFEMISVSDPPALTGRFFGQELRFQKLVDRPYDYQATLIHGDYYVNFLIGSVPSAEKRDPLFLEFSDDPWMTIDEKGTLQLHMPPEK